MQKRRKPENKSEKWGVEEEGTCYIDGDSILLHKIQYWGDKNSKDLLNFK